MQVENFYLKDRLLYHLGKLCIPVNEIVHVIRGAHTSLVSGQFGVGKPCLIYKGFVIGLE